MASATEKKLRLKLMIDKKRNIVLYAEAGKSFVDFIFHILKLPMGAVAKLISNNGTVGTLSNLYDGCQNLEDSYFMSSCKKDEHLLSKAPKYRHLLSKAPKYSGGSSETLWFPHSTNYYSTGISAGLTSVSTDGYVKEMVPYMVMDNLVVTPFSSSSIVTLMEQRKIKEFSELEERTVDFGFEEGVKLLRALLVSTTVLTDVFLGQ